MPVPPEYLIRVRQNSTLALLGEVDDYTRATANPRFNDIGTWVVDISALSPWAPYVKNFANGLIFERDIHDGNGFVPFLSGPITKVRRKGGPEQMLQISGSSDEQLLADRQALPVYNYPYLTSWPKGTFYPAGVPGPLRFYPLNDTSGTTATDVSDSPVNGTYNGGFTLNQPGLIDDPVGCTLFNGTSGYVSAPSTGLPTGVNTPVMLGCWTLFSATPASTQFLMCIGDRDVAGHLLALEVLSSGKAQLSTASVVVNSPTALSANVPHFLLGVFDGSQIMLYVDGQLVAQASASLTLSYAGATPFAIGSQTSGSLGSVPGSFFAGYLGMASCFNTTLGQSLLFSRPGDIYLTGLSRQAFLPSDTNNLLPFAHSSASLLYYASRNAGIGTAQPAARQTLTMAADPAIGTQTYGAARFGSLLKLLQVLALQSTPELGFRVVQVGSVLQFQVYQPVDQTVMAKFSLDLGNLYTYEWELSRPTANHFFLGGAGTGSNRIYAEVEDATSVATYGRIEGFVDRRNVSDIPTVVAYGQAELARAAAQSNLTILPQDTDSLQVFRDYNLGDKVNVQLEDGSVVTDLIRGLQVDLATDKITVTPAVGSPGQGEINATLLLLRKKLITVSDLLDQVAGST